MIDLEGEMKSLAELEDEAVLARFLDSATELNRIQFERHSFQGADFLSIG
jgi:hypothetical protein